MSETVLIIEFLNIVIYLKFGACHLFFQYLSKLSDFIEGLYLVIKDKTKGVKSLNYFF